MYTKAGPIYVPEEEKKWGRSKLIGKKLSFQQEEKNDGPN